MAAMRAPVQIEAARAALERRRGQAEPVQLPLHTALAGPLEGIAFIADVLASVNRITLAAASDSPTAVVNEANRLGQRAMTVRAELRRITARIDGPTDGGTAA